MNNIVTRFAPSPTGFMHIGSLRTALFAWLLARKSGGTFILRIEDTDKEREVEGSIAHIIESLRWLGLEWDYGPDKEAPFGSCIQSERLDTYLAAARELIAKGYAYPDPYTTEEIDAFRKTAQAEKKVFLFRNHRPTHTEMWDGERPLRFKVPEIKRMQWHDEVRGDLSAGEEAVDDFILIKSDGYPTYNFAHIIDDMHMGVTHIVRGDEFISSTPKFISLYQALGITPPKFVSLPPILREDKTKKLGKRDGAKDILEYRSDGYLPEAMLNFLAFIGWHPGSDQELYRLAQLIGAFNISGIQSHGGIANEEKLLWFNREYVQKILTEDEFFSYIEPAFRGAAKARGLEYDAAVLRRMIPLLRTTVSVSSELTTSVVAGEYDYVFGDPKIDNKLLVDKKSSPGDALIHLEYISKAITDASSWSAQALKELLWDYATANGRGAVLWPLRYSLTGREKSADPFAVAEIIGKEASLRRIGSSINILRRL